jgi:hypothetical protein
MQFLSLIGYLTCIAASFELLERIVVDRCWKVLGEKYRRAFAAGDGVAAFQVDYCRQSNFCYRRKLIDNWCLRRLQNRWLNCLWKVTPKGKQQR